MAGDWIPMRVDLAEDPAVISIAGATGLTEIAVVGLLHRIWSWANVQLSDSNAPGVTPAFVDRYVSVPGFAIAMAAAGWLLIHNASAGQSIEFVNFDRWNSQGAKRRLLTARRASNWRAKSNADSNAHHNADRNATSVTSALPKGEERREEKKEETPPPPSGGVLATTTEVAPKRKAKAPAESVAIPSGLDTPEFLTSWAAWLADRRDRGKKVTGQAATLQLAKLAPLGPETAREWIRNAIERGWTGLYDPGPNGQPASRQGVQFTSAEERERERTRKNLLFALQGETDERDRETPEPD